MRPNVFEDDDDNSPQNQGADTIEIDEDYGRRLEHNRTREDLQRYEELKKKGQINDDDDSDSEEDSEPDDDLGDPKKDVKFFDVLNKVKRQHPLIKNKDHIFFESEESDEEEEDGVSKEGKKKKKMYLKDVHGKHLIEEGADYAEKNEERIKTYSEQQEELRRAVSDAMEDGGNESDDDLLRVRENNEDDFEEDEELVKKVDEYFDEEADEDQKFLRKFFVKQLWKEKDEMGMVDEAEIVELEVDDALDDKEEYEIRKYRHEENAGEIVMGQSRIVEGSVRKKGTARKAQRKNKEDRMKIAEIERQEELKQLKNVKKKEMNEKMKKVLSIAGFKEGEECPLDAKDLDDDFNPEEYDKMMKAAFDDNYYGAEDSGLSSDEDDGDKPDFDKEDELLGLPKDWDVIQGGDGFISAREKVLKHKENGAGAGDDEEEEIDVEEEKEEGKRKRKRKTSLVQRAKEALMEEYYKLDYEDTIGDLKTRFKYAKVQPNKYQLETEEILGLDDTELNQYVPLKKMAPYVDKDWEVNRHKVKELKLKNNELQKNGHHHHEKKRSKKRMKSDDVVEKKKPTDEEVEAETSKLSRKAKRRRRQAEKKLPPNRMAAYGKTQN